MIFIKLSELLNGVNVISFTGEDKEITNIITNSNEAKEGCVFVAIKGTKADGHKFAINAQENGAAAVIVEEDTGVSITQVITDNTRKAISLMWANMYKNPAASLTLAGVTGTNGKTTTAFLTQYILESCGIKAGIIGTVENITGAGREPAKYTTPEPSQLQSLLASMRDTGLSHLVMEVSSHALSQDRTAGLVFDAGAFTNLTQDHLDYHKTMDNYLQEKLKLIDISQKAVINIDDKYGSEFVKKAKGVFYTYGIENKADFMAADIKQTADGSNFTLLSPDGQFDTYIGIPGRFSIYNALCAAGLCYALGIKAKKIAEVLKTAKGICGRMESVKTGRDFKIIIDYAHTPDGLLNALKTLKEIPKEGRLIVLFGCGGDRDKEKRSKMGSIACDLADYCIITSDNPRTENPEAIIANILEGIEGTKTPYKVIPNRKEAIKFAIENAKSGDVILLAGKGHETYQELKDGKIHFDEREVISEYINF